jgi:DNA-binding response OmpR family regulator
MESNNIECINSTIIVNKKNQLLLSNNKINNNNILVLNKLPLKIEKIFDEINIQLIKQKYNFHSKLNIKDYTLNFNTRIISNQKKELKLTEREIDIILFLKNKNTPQSVSTLQNKVWGYSFDLETHTVETHIYRLRKKIKDKFNDENFIISEDEGYQI